MEKTECQETDNMIGVAIPKRQEIVVIRRSSSSPLEKMTRKDEARKVKQGQLLLVSLLENFCMLQADKSPEQNQALFFVLCKRLSRMGVIEETDFMHELSSVRESYKRAFLDLVSEAIHSVANASPETVPANSNVIENHPGKLIENEQHSVNSSCIKSSSLVKYSNSNTVRPTISIQRATDFSQLLDSKRSRFKEDFLELGKLGSGAFGKVKKVKNKIDGQLYAVKIVLISQYNTFEVEKIFREVKLLAGINDYRVVRYFSSWLQHFDLDEWSNDGSEEEGYLSSDEESNPESSYEPSDSTREIPLSSFKNLYHGKSLGLFIQMELCSLTLHDWLEKRNSYLSVENLHSVMDDILNCFQDILGGLNVMHSNNCIHRDVKPRNIFYKVDGSGKDAKGVWKIGDFGLATTSSSLFSTLAESFDRSVSPNEHTKEIGTVTYASPEQLDAASLNYTYETDMYSLGIIFFELMYPLSTGMERAKRISDLRQGVLPDELLKLFPKESALILWMTAENPLHRPDAEELLTLDIFTKSNNIKNKKLSASVELQLESFRLENYKLQSENEALVKENAELREKVRELEARLIIN